MAVDGVVIAVGVIIALLLLFGVVVFMVYMQHPEDKMVAWFPKVVVFLGLFLACITVLLVPFDVAIQNGVADQVFSNMSTLWFALFYIVAGWAIVVCPFTIFWYERDEDDTVARQICTAVCFTMIGLFVFIVITAILYVTIGFVELPLMLEAPLIWAQAVAPAAYPSPIPAVNSQQSFFTNTNPTTPGTSCSCPDCLSVTTWIPINSASTPNVVATDGTQITTCYFDHPGVKYSSLASFDGQSVTGPLAAWLTTGHPQLHRASRHHHSVLPNLRHCRLRTARRRGA